MNKVTLSVAALAALAPVYAQAAEEELTDAQKAAMIEAKKAAIDEIRILLNATANHIETNDPNVKEEWLLELSKITVEMNKDYDDDTLLEITDLKKETWKSRINDAQSKADQAQEPYTAKADLDNAYSALETLYKEALAEAGDITKYPYTSETKVAELKKYGVEAIGDQIKGYDLTDTKILDEKAGVLKKIEKATININTLKSNLQKDEDAVKSNETAHAAVVEAYNTAKANYLTQSQEAIAKLPSANYKDWQEKAVAELMEQYRIINDAKAQDDALYAEKNSGTAKGKWATVINTANVEINNIVIYYVALMKAQEALNNDYAAKIQEQQDELNKIIAALGKYNLLECNNDINAAQTLIDNLKKEIAEIYAKHELKKDKYGNIDDIEKAINTIDDNAGHTWTAVIENYEAKVWMDGEIATLQQELNDAKVAAEKLESKDTKYKPAGYFSNYATTIIQTSIDKLKTDVNTKYTEYKAVSFKDYNFAESKGTINTYKKNYETWTNRSLVSYETAAKNIVDNQALLDKLVETATDTNVTVGGELDGVTYATKITTIKDKIESIKTAIKKANEKKNVEHKKLMDTAAGITMSENIQELTDKYADYKSVYDKNNAVKAANNVLEQTQIRIDAVQAILNEVVADPTMGNQEQTITDKKAEHQATLDAIKATKTDAENTFNKIASNDKASDDLKKEAAAQAIATLANVDTELKTLEENVATLKENAQAAVANKAAYDRIQTAIDAANQAMLDALDNVINPLDHSAALEFYRTTMKGYKDALDKVQADADKAYGDVKAATNEEDLTKKANAVKANAEKFAEDVLVNENTYGNQTSDLAILQAKWTEYYNKISDKDLSNKAADYLAELAKELEKINALKTTVDNAFVKGESDKQDADIQAELKAITDAVEAIAKASKDNYDANVDATNKAQNDDFLKVYEAANTKFSEAIKTLNAFSSIKNGALQTALDNLIETHDAIYAYADKLRKLKSDEDADYNKYVLDTTDGVDDIYSAQTWIDKANTFNAEIKDLIEGYQNKVNAKAKELFETTLTNAKTAVASKKDEIKNFVYDEKADAFKDVEDVIAEAEKVGNATDDKGNIIDKDYAIKVDTWMVTLDTELYTKLGNDVNKACQAEYDKLHGDAVKVYNDEKSKIEKFAYIDNAAYLQELADLKASTIDYAEKNFWTSVYSIENYVRPAIAQYFGTDENTKNSDVYQRAANESAESTANLEAYGRIDKALNLLVSDFNDVVATIKTVIVAHQAGAVNAKIAEIERALEAQRTEIEAWREAGSCDENEETFNSFLSEKNRDGYPQMIAALKKLTVEQEVVALNAIIDEVKEEYNQVAKTDLDKVKDYDAQIKKLYSDVESIEVKYNNSKDDIFEGTCSAFVAQEAAIAKVNSDLNALYENTQVADAKAAIDAAIESISAPLAQAEGWATYNAATQAFAGEEIQALRGEYELIKADYEAKVEAGQILFYKDQLLYDLDNVAKAIPGWGSALYNEYNKQLTNDNVYSQLSTQLTNYSASLEAAYERINGFTHRNKINGQDIINNTYSNLNKSIEKYGEQLEKDHNDVKLSSWGELNTKINGLNSSIYDMEKNACTFEANGALYDIQASVDASLAIKSKSLYGGDRGSKLQDTGNEINRLAGLAISFNEDAQDNSISNDIDGKDVRIKNVYGEYVYYYDLYINYLEESYTGPSAWSILSERIAKLQADAEQLANDVVELAYILGDADNDKRITVNDYSEVREWILKAKKFEDVSEAKRYAGDVNGDKEFTVADMTGISNLIFHGSVTGPQAGAPSRARAFDASADQLTVANESENTTIFGKTVRMAINLSNAETFTAGQMDIILPQGMKLAGQELSARANGHELLASELGNGAYRMVASTVDNNAFNGSNGALIFIDVEVGSDYNGGNITIDNVIFSDAQANSYYLSKNGPIVPTGIDGIEAASVKERIYSVGGQMMKAVKKGINIIVGENNKTQKVVK